MVSVALQFYWRMACKAETMALSLCRTAVHVWRLDFCGSFGQPVDGPTACCLVQQASTLCALWCIIRHLLGEH